VGHSPVRPPGIRWRQLGIPGASIALIDRGKIVYEGGFGVRELGKPEKVDENTVFMAASNTKGMTTLLLAELVDEKKLRWDEPVIEAYPAFKLGDADTTKKVLVKNLICACTGVPRQDLEWLFEFKNATPETELALLGTMQPTSKFGEVFQYSNMMAAAAGYIGAHLVYPNLELGAAYDKAMQEKIFDPLGMKATTFDYARALAGNHATPHGDDIDGKPTVASMAINYSIVPARPAGAVWTSSADLIRYVQDELALGKLPNGNQLVSAENLLMRRAPQISLGEDANYGMGLIVDHTYGVQVVSHGGSMSGFKSNLYFLPDSGIGAVLLTNSDNGDMLLGPFGRRLLEVIFDGKPEAVAEVSSRAARHKAELAKERERLVGEVGGRHQLEEPARPRPRDREHAEARSDVVDPHRPVSRSVVLDPGEVMRLGRRRRHHVVAPGLDESHGDIGLDALLAQAAPGSLSGAVFLFIDSSGPEVAAEAQRQAARGLHCAQALARPRRCVRASTPRTASASSTSSSPSLRRGRTRTQTL